MAEWRPKPTYPVMRVDGEHSYLQEILRCPECGEGGGTHLEIVRVSARGEDEPVNEISVTTGSGAVVTHRADQAPVGAYGVGRRDRVSLIGSCEMCNGKWAVIFTQHKGTTVVETAPWGA
jgi:hypothetical protein